MVSGALLGTLMTAASIRDWVVVRQAARSGVGAIVEGPVHGFDATPLRGHTDRFSVGGIRFEVPSSLTQTSLHSARIRDGVAARVTYIDPPITQPYSRPTVLRLEVRE